MKRSALALGLAWVGACIGSGSVPVVEEVQGELGNGTFRWECTTPAGDATCGTGVFPEAVALGGRFDLEFTPRDELPDDVTFFEVVSVSPSRLSDASGHWEAKRQGGITMLAVGEGFGVDYIELELLPIDSLLVSAVYEPDPCESWDCEPDTTGALPPGRPVDLRVGEPTQLRARPYHGPIELGGSVEYTWQNLTPQRATMSTPSGRTVKLEPLAAGTVELQITAGDFSTVVRYEVQEPPEEPPSATGDPGSEGSGSDSGSGSDDADTEADTEGTESETEGTETEGTETDTEGETEGATTTGGV